MKPVNFFYVCFTSAICYQLVCTNFIQAENNTEVEINDTTLFINIEPEVIIEHLVKPSSYKMSKKGLDFIKSTEKCVLTAYDDPDPNRRSIGWGHQLRPGENFEHITQAKADALFEEDVQWVNNAINRLIKQNDKRFIYTQGFIDGLGSLIYNCGERGVTLTEFYARWQKCRYDKNEPGYINKSDLNFTIAGVKTSRISSPGHPKRRYDEHKLMLN